jgi:hypothetical protein
VPDTPVILRCSGEPLIRFDTQKLFSSTFVDFAILFFPCACARRLSWLSAADLLCTLLTTPLIAGVLVGRWRASTPERAGCWRDRITGGMLAGALSAELTLLVVKGGVVDEAFGWIQGHGFQGGEVLEFCIATGFLGALLGSAGGVLAMILDRVRRQGRQAPST